MTPFGYGYEDGLLGAYNNLYDDGTFESAVYDLGYAVGREEHENVR